MKRLLTIFAVTLIIGFLLPNSALAEEVSSEHQEGYVQQGDGCYYVVSWCKGHEENNSRSIYGEFCFLILMKRENISDCNFLPSKYGLL